MELDRKSKLTGKQWSAELNVNILDPKGWDCIDDYNNDLIYKFEFLNRASCSVIAPVAKISRREASKFKSLLNK